MIPRQQVTMTDVADRLGVSVATVSRALSGRPGVSDDMRQRVLEEARVMSYVASAAATSLVTGVSRRVGVVLPGIETWFYSAVLSGLADGFRVAGLDLSVYYLPTPRDRYDFFERLPLGRNVDAVVLVSIPLAERSRTRLRKTGIPVVAVSTQYAGFPSVGIDDRQAAHLAVSHLTRSGHRRIALIRGADPGGEEWLADVERAQGYADALAAAGIELDDTLVVKAPWGIDGGARAMQDLLSMNPPPTAVFCYSDEVAIGALRTLRRSGIDVPRQMSVIAIDDHPMAELMDLTTISQSAFEQGRAAATIVESMLAGEAAESRQFATSLIVRHSTGSPAE